MRRRIWILYLAAWLPVFLFYFLATQGEGLFNGNIRVGQGLLSAACCLGPAIPLLFLVWPLTGYLKRANCSTAASAAIHVGSAIFLTVLCMSLAAIFVFYYGNPDATKSDLEQWLIWQSWGYLMMYAVSAGIFHAIRAIETTRLQSVAIAQAEALLAKSELTALRNKLNPHFLFNTLHSIIALTRKESGAAENALLKFSDMLRYILDTEKSGDAMVTLDEELKFVRDYLALEALRLGSRLHVEWDIDDAARYHLLPALTVQPLVENSIKHAFNPHSRPGKLAISAHVNSTDNTIAIAVSDDGPGCDALAMKESGGLGVKTVARRLQLEYGQRGNLEIRTAPGAGCAIHLSIPLEAA
ncbi:sensor histidine kinase [Collimonas pratensis]|uniref:Histidine kinase-, DNA gyrase B-, and HSP90-like ATPase family protein n=1 Tax=Collimonas pratensis TaxID=279113 RepID=A0A127Q2Q0_9BURK|nr:histidine kinase [Collimonas pratensis]AMP04314.1 histidine kinase-, DNA gyrase B-, and HSP90-like ATPase family protein [Collimonas pratensis]AMP15696.1 histidine kinase-, DNA gyrase B-, and HSP90-like ATPase family protein [Collimonas pratensis]